LLVLVVFFDSIHSNILTFTSYPVARSLPATPFDNHLAMLFFLFHTSIVFSPVKSC